MELNLILKKQVGLSALETTDSKIRRLFILADGRRTVKELFALCGFGVDQGAAITEKLLADGALSTITAVPLAPGKSTQATDAATKKLIDTLAHYLGPIAAILVQNSVQPESVLTEEQFAATVNDLAGHIEADNDRQKFLADMGLFIAE